MLLPIDLQISEILASTIIIIPCYNEEKRLPVNAFREFFQQFPQCQFCFVDDGSHDETQLLLKNLTKDYSQTRVLSLEENRGKAEAIRYGVLQLIPNSHLRYIGYWDADLSTPLEEIFRFLEIFQSKPHLSLIAGSRVQLMGRRIERHWYRHYLGRVFATIASLTLRLPIYDTQCGAKLLRIELTEKVFQQPFLSSWLFDVEIIARMNHVFGREQVREKVYEIPLNTWINIAASKLKISDFIKAPFQLAKIFYYYNWRKPVID